MTSMDHHSAMVVTVTYGPGLHQRHDPMTTDIRDLTLAGEESRDPPAPLVLPAGRAGVAGAGTGRAHAGAGTDPVVYGRAQPARDGRPCPSGQRRPRRRASRLDRTITDERQAACSRDCRQLAPAGQAHLPGHQHHGRHRALRPAPRDPAMTSRPLAASGQAGSISTSVPLLVLSVLRGAYVDPASGKVPFGEWAERWYASTAALRPSTRRDYRKSLDLEVLPRFRDLSLAAIDTLMVREWLAGLAKRGLGAKRAGKALQVLSQVLASAVEGDRLARNVAAGVRKPKVQRRETAFLSAAQVERLAEAVGPPYDTLVRFTAYTGLRPCELTALRVGRVDVLSRTVRVCEAAPEVDGRLEWGGVKTHEACTVRLPRFLATELGTQ